ncbi:hypothetical protein Egran_04565 [Elaphomyces granulatus]|uniref:Protein root UVB sensitive/RUS domain-containing protein n=1 Tax=Elaphomyces granulatus TaxID=519963 RepID=A0A232LU24_9EURO|nr:hypothetical protein Egran_04565 [Elaphomyces granulatus]
MASENSRVILTVAETDEVDTPIATYVYSEQKTAGDIKGKGRIDVISGPDSIQAFSSSIAGLLASRAVLQGVGVGDAAASPTSALLLHILQDSSGRIATILFAHRLGTALEPECKMYRLAADVFNDVAMVLDCLSPLLRIRSARVALLSSAGVLRALCGVTGGSSKASLSAHFAKWGNIAELNAKDSSQETIISLLGMLVGSLVVSHVTSVHATWAALFLLLTLHLSANYAAVRSVQMTSLNRQRANIVFSTLLDSDQELDLETLICGGRDTQDTPIKTWSRLYRTLRPEEVARRERIFERDGVLRWIPESLSSSQPVIGFCQIGGSLQDLVILMMNQRSSSSSPDLLHGLIRLFSLEAYVLFISHRANIPQAFIVLKKGCTPVQQLKAWTHALLVSRVLSRRTEEHSHLKQQQQHIFNIVTISYTLDFLNQDSRFERLYVQKLVEVGWDLNIAALETRPGRRITISSSS